MTVAPSPPEAAVAEDRLSHFPVSFFAVVMGLAGLTIAAFRLEAALSLSHGGSLVLFWLAGAVYAAIAAVYLAKAVTRPAALAAEWAHPVRISFFPAMSIGLILLSIAALRVAPALSLPLWLVGSGLHLVFTVLVMTAWINHARYQIVHLNPAWFIPVVGNILVPIAGISHAPADVSWFFFAIGLLFWLVLLTVVVNRLIFHNPLPARLMPTLFILIAPPAVGFLSWTMLVGGVDPFGRLLFFAADFFFLLLLPQLAMLARLPFTLSWWAYSFPLAALTIAQFTMAEHGGGAFYRACGYGLFGVLALLILGLAARTLLGLARREFCVPEH